MERFAGAPVRSDEIARALVRKRRLGFDHLTLTGGEPTMHAGFERVLQAAKRLGYRTYVTSNGSRLAESGFARRVLPLIDELCLSVHGARAREHDACAGRAGSFSAVRAAIERAAARPELYLLTNTVATTRNVDRLPEILSSLIAKRAVRHCLVSNLAPEGRGGRNFESLTVPLARWRTLIPNLARVVEGSGTVLRFFGLPLCVFGGRRELSNDLHWSPRVTLERGLRRGRPVLVEVKSAAPTRRRRRTAACRSCAMIGRCPGVFEEYARLFGCGELSPIDREAHG